MNINPKHCRRITNRELADLPTSWLNAKVDTSKYIPCAMEAWEVTEGVYTKLKHAGTLCQMYNDRYYVA